MRGEYPLPVSVVRESGGSPPHAWGIRPLCYYRRRPVRFTPTCVGNTSARAISSDFLAVHPHMRGEYPNIQWTGGIPDGSPPHAWGILLNRVPVHKGKRFTPTCVGNTLKFRSWDIGAFYLIIPFQCGWIGQGGGHGERCGPATAPPDPRSHGLWCPTDGTRSPEGCCQTTLAGLRRSL